MTASRQASVDAHAVGRDRRGKAKLSIETRPDARQEAERAHQDAQETHDRRHPDDTHKEAVKTQEEDAEEQGDHVVDGRQHRCQKLAEADLEDGARGRLERGGTRAGPQRRSHRISGRIHDLVDRTRSEREKERAQLLEATRIEQTELYARSPPPATSMSVAQTQDRPHERVGHVNRLDARQPRVTLSALEDTCAIPNRRVTHRVAGLRPRQVAVRARDGETTPQSSQDRGRCQWLRATRASHR